MAVGQTYGGSPTLTPALLSAKFLLAPSLEIGIYGIVKVGSAYCWIRRFVALLPLLVPFVCR